MSQEINLRETGGKQNRAGGDTFSEQRVDFQRTVQHYIPEDANVQVMTITQSRVNECYHNYSNLISDGCLHIQANVNLNKFAAHSCK
jgi:hypothetical protein